MLDVIGILTFFIGYDVATNITIYLGTTPIILLFGIIQSKTGGKEDGRKDCVKGTAMDAGERAL